MASEYHDRIWAALADDPVLPLETQRREFLLGALQPGWRVLDLGCGDGRFAGAAAAAGASVVGADVSPKALASARNRYPELELRELEVGERLPFADNEFDCVFCSEVISQVVDVQEFVSELRRVLKPAGRLLLTAPGHGRVQDAVAALAGFERHFSPWQPQLRFFTKRSLRELLDSFDFDELQVRGVGGLPLARRALFAAARRRPFGAA